MQKKCPSALPRPPKVSQKGSHGPPMSPKRAPAGTKMTPWSSKTERKINISEEAVPARVHMAVRICFWHGFSMFLVRFAYFAMCSMLLLYPFEKCSSSEAHGRHARNKCTWKWYQRSHMLVSLHVWKHGLPAKRLEGKMSNDKYCKMSGRCYDNCKAQKLCLNTTSQTKCHTILANRLTSGRSSPKSPESRGGGDSP